MMSSLGGEVQNTLVRPDGLVPLAVDDIVAPLVVRGTDIGSAAMRKELIELRTEALNLRRLLKKNQKGGSLLLFTYLFVT